MTPSDAMAWICARDCHSFAYGVFVGTVLSDVRPEAAAALHRIEGARDACLLLLPPDDLDGLIALHAVWSRWLAFRWAVEHPDDPMLVPAEEE